MARTWRNGGLTNLPGKAARLAGLAVLAGSMVAVVTPAVAQAGTVPAGAVPKFTHWCDTQAWRTTKSAAIQAAVTAAENQGCDEIESATAVPQSEEGVAGWYATVEAIEPG